MVVDLAAWNSGPVTTTPLSGSVPATHNDNFGSRALMVVFICSVFSGRYYYAWHVWQL